MTYYNTAHNMAGNKNKGKTKKQQKKGGRKAKPQAPRAKRGAMVLSMPGVTAGKQPNGIPSAVYQAKGTHQAVCAMTDPFCSHSIGAKIPDGNGALTVPYRSWGYRKCTTGAGTMFALLFAPDNRSDNFCADANVTNTTFVLPSAFTTVGGQGSFFSSYVAQSRVVSAGIRWVPTMPTTQAAPLAFITEVSNPSNLLGFNNGGLGVVTTIGTNPQFVDLRQPWTHIMRRSDPTAMKFGTVANTASSGSYNGILVQVIGAATTDYGYFELVVNWETILQLDDTANSIANALVTRGPPKDVHALSALEKVGQTVDTVVTGGFKQTTDYLGNLAKSALDDVVSEGLALLGL